MKQKSGEDILLLEGAAALSSGTTYEGSSNLEIAQDTQSIESQVTDLLDGTISPLDFF